MLIIIIIIIWLGPWNSTNSVSIVVTEIMGIWRRRETKLKWERICMALVEIFLRIMQRRKFTRLTRTRTVSIPFSFATYLLACTHILHAIIAFSSLFFFTTAYYFICIYLFNHFKSSSFKTNYAHDDVMIRYSEILWNVVGFKKKGKHQNNNKNL